MHHDDPPDQPLDFCCGSKRRNCPVFTPRDDGSLEISDPDVFAGSIRLDAAEVDRLAAWFERRRRTPSAQVDLHSDAP